MDRVLVTLDTSAIRVKVHARVSAAAEGLPIDFVRTSVTDRETRWPLERRIPETAVVGESRVDRSVVGSPDTDARRRAILALMSANTYPHGKEASELSNGYLNMRRDAMILNAHVRERRDIFVTQNTAQFGAPGTRLRRELEALCSTRIMTVDEFCAYCQGLSESGHAQ